MHVTADAQTPMHIKPLSLQFRRTRLRSFAVDMRCICTGGANLGSGQVQLKYRVRLVQHNGNTAH